MTLELLCEFCGAPVTDVSERFELMGAEPLGLYGWKWLEDWEKSQKFCWSRGNVEDKVSASFAELSFVFSLRFSWVLVLREQKRDQVSWFVVRLWSVIYASVYSVCRRPPWDSFRRSSSAAEAVCESSVFRARSAPSVRMLCGSRSESINERSTTGPARWQSRWM